ncbi:MAG: hypothetical protein KBG04_08220, partial [Bacteroidales bacterium]|nr:hypothetical protein [Bacteroidales bacterium]
MKQLFRILIISIITNALLCTVSVANNKDFKKIVKYVNPFIGTGGHGHTFPGATYPFGMMQLSPDT